MATILLLDTSDAESVAAVSADGTLCSERRHTGVRDGAAMLNFLVDDALADAGVGFGNLDAISVVAGPGSYTGVRVAVATAKGFCFALGVPLIGHNKLDLLAETVSISGTHSNVTIVSALPARAAEWFAGIYGPEKRTLLAPQHLTEQDLRDAIKKLGSAVHWVGSTPPENDLSVKYTSNEAGRVDMSVWAQVSQRLFDLKQFENIAAFAPYYLKAPFVTVPQSKTP